MTRMIGLAALLLAAQSLAMAASAQGQHPRAARSATSEAGVRPPPAQRRASQTAPKPPADQPVTPSADYFPYDRRTGGM
jgi:hypothetical protein